MRDHLRNHFAYAAARTRGGRVEQVGALLTVDSGLDCDTFNAVLAGRMGREGAEALIGNAVAAFGGRAFSWWHGPDAPAFLPDLLRSCGLAAAEREVAMRLDRGEAAAGPEPVPGLEVRRVADEAALRDYAAVIAANWSPPDPDVLAFYAGAAEPLLRPSSPLVLLLGHLEGTPVATAELATGDDGVAGIYGVATLAERRGRGIGASLTGAAIAAGWASGAAAIELQASPDGAGIYRRLGFRDHGAWTEFKPAGTR